MEIILYIQIIELYGWITKSPDKFVYLRLDSFCALVNTILPCDKDKKSVIKMNTQMAKIGEDSDIPLCRFRTYDFHTSSDPGVCLLVTPSTKKWASGQLYPGIIEYPTIKIY